MACRSLIDGLKGLFELKLATVKFNSVQILAKVHIML